MSARHPAGSLLQPPLAVLPLAVPLVLLLLATACDPALAPRCVTASSALSDEARRAAPHPVRLAARLDEASALLEAQRDEPWRAVEDLEAWLGTLALADQRLPAALHTLGDAPPPDAEVTAYLAAAHLRLDAALAALAERDPAAAQAAAAALLGWLGKP